MMNERVATVIMARCRQSKQPFGIRVEKKEDVWFCTWTFPMEERVAKNEGYDTMVVSGRMALDDEYPGCPHCHASGWFRCGYCGKITCQAEETHVTCAWCGKKARTVLADSFDLRGGGY